MERIPKSGEFYRHFKNKLYQIVTVAEHTESGEALVVYQALYGDYRTYARPLSMFISKVDQDRYPDVIQEYRFEYVVMSDAVISDMDTESETTGVNQYLMAFLDAESYDKQMELLTRMKGHVGKKELDSICTVMDIPQGSDSIESQLSDIERHLSIRNRYDGSRLR